MAIGVLCALSAGVFRYVDQHFHTADTFLEDNAALAVNADVRERLFDGFRTELIAIAEGRAQPDGSEEAAEETGTLGSLLQVDDDEPGADPVTEARIARDQAIEEVLLDVFDSPKYDQVFTAALKSAQQQIVRSADLEPAALLRDKGEIKFDMHALYQTIYPALALDDRTYAITENVVPDSYGVFAVADRETTVNLAWTLLRNGPGWRSLTLAGAVLSLIGALVIAERRPSRAIQFGGGMFGVGVVVIVLIYLIRFVVPLLSGGGSSAGSVVAVYASNLWPLVRIMIRLAILGAILAFVGWIARLIWPDDWVYSSVSDDRGVRSIMRRRGAPEPEPQPVQVAAAVPVPYPGYGQPYGAYPQQWPPGYPPQQLPPGYVPYPVGPYAAPAQPIPQSQHYTSSGRPTVPVMPVTIDPATIGGDAMVAPAAPPLDGDGVSDALPADAAQIVPRVVAHADATIDAANASSAEAEGASEADHDGQTAGQDEWPSEPDW